MESPWLFWKEDRKSILSQSGGPNYHTRRRHVLVMKLMMMMVMVIFQFIVYTVDFKCVFLSQCPSFKEGACILTGLSYDGKGKDGKVKWNGLRNIKMRRFEFGHSFQSVIESFNLNTNQWAARYVRGVIFWTIR